MMMPEPIYFDNAASTPLDKRVFSKMRPHLGESTGFANPASRHPAGVAAAEAIAGAASSVRDLVGTQRGEVVWTSSATEANNLAILGFAQAYLKRGQHIITTQQEHVSVLAPCQQFEKQGFAVTYLPVDSAGLLSVSSLAEQIRDDTLLVSIAHVNSETGVIQPIAEVADLCRERGVLLHVDAAQSAGKVPIAFDQWGVALLTVSAHKVYGPKGIGALVMRSQPRLHLQPRIYGGHQQGAIRSGTLPTALIVGMGEAFRIAATQMVADNQRIRVYRERLLQCLQAFEAVRINGTLKQRLPHNLNFRVDGVHGDALVYAVSGLAISHGSACSASKQQPSAVLQAMGLSPREASDSVRLTMGRFNTATDIDRACQSLTRAIDHLVRLSV